MNIVVADGDRGFTELLRGVIEREGHKVVVVDDVARALQTLVDRRPRLLVVAVGLSDGGAVSLVPTLRALPRGHDVAIVLLVTGTEHMQRPVRELIAEYRIHRVLHRPFPMFDLVDLVRDLDLGVDPGGDEPSLSLAPVVPAVLAGRARQTLDLPLLHTDRRLSSVSPPSGSAFLKGPVRPGNVRFISRLWARRDTGVVRLSDGPESASGWAVISGGGPMDAGAWELLSAALHGGQLDFEARRVEGAGDHLGLGAMIFGRLRPADGDDFLRRVSFIALIQVLDDAPLASLPLVADTRTLLQRASPSAPLGEIVSRGGLNVAAVSADLFTLDLMGLVRLGEASISVSPRQPPPTRSPAPFPASARPSPVAPAALAGASARAITAGSSAAELGSLSESNSSPTHIQPGGMRKRRLDPGSQWPRLRRRLAERGRNWATRHAAQNSTSEITDRIESLRRELERVQAEEAPVILGVPASAAPDFVDKVAARMRARYRGMSTDPALPREGQRLAEDMLACIERAHQDMRTGRPMRARRADDAQLPEEERLLAAARVRIDSEEWPEALRLLRRARDLRLDHPGVLAWLGWAVLHDVDLSPGKRVDDARALLLLAVQFAPRDGFANLLLARFLSQQGEYLAAQRFAERATRQLPDEPDAMVVLNAARAAISRADSAR